MQRQPLPAERRSEHQARLKQHLQAVREGQAAVRAELQATGEHLKKTKAPNVILERQQLALAQFDQRSKTFEQLSSAWLKDPSDANLSALATFFEQNPAQRKAAPFDPKKLPWSSPKPTTRTPAETKAAWFQQLWGQEKVRTAQTSTVGPITFQIPPEPGQAPTEADLAATEDAPITDVVRAKAAELGNNPAAILRWAHNNLEWVPSWGSLQGAEATVVMRRGNAADIASATIALLRAANIPARYVVGTIEVDADLLVNWIGGAESVEAAMSLMQQGGIATVGVASGGRIAKVRMEHVWIQAYVNWAPARGARQGSATQHVNPVGPHNSWIEIDPSFKQHTFSTPVHIAAAVPLDVTALRSAVTAGAVVNTTQGFVSGIQESNALEQINAYSQRVQNYLDARPNLTGADLIKQREIVSATSQYLTGVLAQTVLNRQVLVTLPGSLRHAITLKLYASEAERADGSAALSYRVSLPALNYRRLGVSYEGASGADQQLIDSAVASGATSLPAYLVNVRPVLKLDDLVLATGPAARMASAHFWSVGFEDPAGANGGEVTFSNSAGDELVFGLNANGVAPDIVFKRAAQTSTSTAQGNLEVAALLYWLEHDLFDQMAANETKVLTMRMPSVTQTAMPLTTRYFLGIARSASYQSVSGDAQRVLTAVAGRDENARRQHLLATGLQGSAIEGSVLDQLYTRPEETSVSTTQYFGIAIRQGLKLYSITGENISAVLPQLAVTQSVKDDIVNAIAAGYVAFAPESDITHKGYTGIGYMLLDPSTGAGAYLIDGGRNGHSMPTCRGSARAQGGEISLQSVFAGESLASAVTGLANTAADTPETLQAKRLAFEAIERARISSMRTIAQRAPARVLAAAVPGLNVAVGVNTAVELSIILLMFTITVMLVLRELQLQTTARTEEDKRCKCELSPNAPECDCSKTPVPHKPPRNPSPSSSWSIYDRRVDYHHTCADNPGLAYQNSYPGSDVVISKPGFGARSVDLFDEGRRLACEVKISFKNQPYDAYVSEKWKAATVNQLQEQKEIAEKCNWSHCVVVNKQWMADLLRGSGFVIHVVPSCGAASTPSDPNEQPTPPLDWD